MKKTIFITGAASGIGKTTAKYFAEKGWFVGLFDINEKELKQVYSEIGPDHSCYQVMDVCDYKSVEAAMTAFLNYTEGKMDILLNNAGVGYTGRYEQIEVAHQMKTVDVNLKGTLNCINVCLPALKNTPGSYIINMASLSAIYGMQKIAVYSATKFAIKGLTEALNIEFEKYDITVCDILPSYVRTPMILEANVPPNLRPNSLKTLGLSLGPEDVSQVIWKAAHRKKVHWFVIGRGQSVYFIIVSFIIRLFPFTKKRIMKIFS